jgi:hypothetical protein
MAKPKNPKAAPKRGQPAEAPRGQANKGRAGQKRQVQDDGDGASSNEGQKRSQKRQKKKRKEPEAATAESVNESTSDSSDDPELIEQDESRTELGTERTVEVRIVTST